MSDAEQYLPSAHPLARIHTLRLEPYFERRGCAINCPRCSKQLHAYHYKPTWGIGFFICPECYWFHARPCLFTIIEQAERPPVPRTSNAALGATLDRIARKVLPGHRTHQPFYKSLSGGKRSA